MTEISSKEELLGLHRKQKKELQAQIQSLKKSVPKGDRQRLKQVQKKIEEMENQLKAKQLDEMNSICVQVDDKEDNINNWNDTSIENASLAQQPKISKAQRNRDKKEMKAKNLSARLLAAEADYVNSARYIEENQIKNKLNALGLQIKQIPSDGDCLYSAVIDQLSVEMSVSELRKKTSEHIYTHSDDFLPFLMSNSTGSVMQLDEFNAYCDEIKKPSTWGGQIELLALCCILRRPIHVVQANSSTTVHGDHFNVDQPIILTYHKHELGLGEHYNSVTKRSDD